MSGPSRIYSVVLVVAAVVASLTASRAASAQPAPKLTITMVLARAEPGAADPSLGPLAPMLRKSFPDHRHFRLLGSTTLQASQAKAEAVLLPNGSSLLLTYRGSEKGYLRLDLAIPPRLKTSVRVAPGGTFFQAGLPHDGGILVLAITAAAPE